MRLLRRGLRRVVRPVLVLALFLAAGLVVLWLLHPLPEAFHSERPGGPAAYDREGRPLLILADDDGQWHLPVPLDRMSPWLASATIAVEDSRFQSHRGVDPAALLRAVGQNLGSGRVVSGASTITMQLCRLLDPRPRTLRVKVSEAFRALRLERLLTKDQILERYLNLAPYGGNVVGVEAASRVWFGKRALDLSLPEAALLAGLPQSPTSYRPDRYPDRAKARRRQVLRRMREEGRIDDREFERADGSPVRCRRLADAGLRMSATVGRHAAWWALARNPAGGRTTLDLGLQRAVERAARAHAASLPPGSDVAVAAVHIETGEIRALVGSAEFADPLDGQVNGALALRSPGSTLKPFLFATAFATGRLAPKTQVPDEAIDRRGFRPENFQPGFAGYVPAGECLRRSLNLPAMRVMEAAGVARCVGAMRAAGIPFPDGTVARGGLTIATGSVEVRLLDLVNAYATIGRGGVHRPASLFPDEESASRPALDPRACAEIDHILSSRAREPNGLAGMDSREVRWFMWKTGTSSGRRDAWAVGHNRRFAIGVWVGRFAGEGRLEYTGAGAAEPLLARLFQDPLLATDEEPAAPPERTPRRPFFAKRDRRPPRITTPSPDAVFLAVGGTAVVHPECNRGESGSWFLNDAPLSAAQVARLVLSPGRYELRLAATGGGGAAVRFTVRE